MIGGKRLFTLIVVGLLIIAFLVGLVYVLIQRKNSQIPEQIPAKKPEVSTAAGATDSTDSESQTEQNTEAKFEDIKKSDGLIYSLGVDGESYIVTGIGDCMDKDIVIPETFNDKPVTAIGDGAFAGATIETISFSRAITKIGSRVFVGCESLKIFFYGTKEEWLAIQKSEDWKEQCSVKIQPMDKQENNWEVPIG